MFGVQLRSFVFFHHFFIHEPLLNFSLDPLGNLKLVAKKKISSFIIINSDLTIYLLFLAVFVLLSCGEEFNNNLCSQSASRLMMEGTWLAFCRLLAHIDVY